MNRKLDSESMGLINTFESATGAAVKDCIIGDRVLFIVEENQMGKAIGKNGVNIKKMEYLLKKKIRLAEFNSDAAQFVKNLVYPNEVSVEKKESTITVHCKDSGTRAMVIGRERQNINTISDIAKRYFDVTEIKVA
ncbi:MAG: NusA-like transcription termination signal-binding factor [Nanoarchaeota archaeon]